MTLNVGIIGGGLSGLTAAYELQRHLGNNVHITIIEKESQLGGRIFTKTFRDCPIELGAQFFINDGAVQHLIQSLNLEKDSMPLTENFISFYYKNKLYSREQLSVLPLFQGKGKREKKLLLDYAKTVDTREEFISLNFNDWYQRTIGGDLLPFWNRLLISIGVKDVKSINAYYGLILINVFFGKNYLLKVGLKQLICKVEEKILSSDGEILKNATCNAIEKKDNTYRIAFEKDGKKNQMLFDRIISAIQPQELIEICNLDVLKPLQKIDGYPMTLYVVQVNTKLWDKTWGLIICEQNSPILALCDWKNVTSVNEETPILVICSPDTTQDEVISELKRLFPKHKPQCKIIFEKKWAIGLHQPNAEFFKIHKMVIEELPDGLYLAGDWMILPALEGAVLSGMKSAKLLMEEVGGKKHDF